MTSHSLPNAVSTMSSEDFEPPCEGDTSGFDAVSGEDESSSAGDSSCWPCCFLAFCFSFLALLAAALAAASSSSAISCCRAVSAEASVLSSEPGTYAKDSKAGQKAGMAVVFHLVAELKRSHLQPCPTRTNKPLQTCYLQDWVGHLGFDKSRSGLRPRQQMPYCMTVQLSLTLLYSNPAGLVLVPRLSLRLLRDQITTASTSPI